MTERDAAYYAEELSVPAAKEYEHDDVPQCKQPVREWDYSDEPMMADGEYADWRNATDE